jgi:putative iron-regulated protein
MTGPEGRLNGWPMDENYIDYTRDQASAGIVNNPAVLPELTKEALAELNEKGGEKNLSTGYHAIEFLLWGQDLNDAGHEREPGRRPHTDYVVGAGSTAQNQMRRGQYLSAVAELVVDDLASVEAAWDLSRLDSYGARFVAGDPKDALQKMLQGIGYLAGTELSSERMNNAYESRDQEEEHSCFSDTTVPIDHLGDAIGIQNVWLGRSGATDGPGLDELVRATDAALADRVTARIEEMTEAIRAIPAPFDRALVDDAPGGGRQKIRAALDKTRATADALVEAANVLGVRINLE